MTMTATEYLSVTQAERDRAHANGNSLPDKSYPINNVHQLHAAAVLAASHHGDWKAAMALIRRRAKELGVDVNTLPGFGPASHSALHDPGFELRKRRRAGMTGVPERRGMLLEVRARPDGTGGTAFEFEGYGAVFNTPFDMWDKTGEPYVEVVKPGAFTRTLSRPDLDVPFLIGHDESRLALARTKNGTLQLAQDAHGMHVLAKMDGRRSDVRDLAYAVERGDQDEMSIGFITRQQAWDDSYETRSMLDLDLHRGDVSSVALAANSATAGATITFPTETLSRRAQVPNAVMDDADHDHMVPKVAPNHGPVTETHTHLHAAGDGPDADGDGMHGHSHSHSGDNLHHAHDHAGIIDDSGAADVTGPAQANASWRPLEHRGNPVDSPLGDAPDYSPWKNTPGAMQCTNCSKIQSPSANFCDNCGYGGDALVRLNDDGVPAMEEEQGEAATLALRRRTLEFLALSRSGGVA